MSPSLSDESHYTIICGHSPTPNLTTPGLVEYHSSTVEITETVDPKMPREQIRHPARTRVENVPNEEMLRLPRSLTSLCTLLCGAVISARFE